MLGELLLEGFDVFVSLGVRALHDPQGDGLAVVGGLIGGVGGGTARIAARGEAHGGRAERSGGDEVPAGDHSVSFELWGTGTVVKKYFIRMPQDETYHNLWGG